MNLAIFEVQSTQNLVNVQMRRPLPPAAVVSIPLAVVASGFRAAALVVAMALPAAG